MNPENKKAFKDIFILLIGTILIVFFFVNKKLTKTIFSPVEYSIFAPFLIEKITFQGHENNYERRKKLVTIL